VRSSMIVFSVVARYLQAGSRLRFQTVLAALLLPLACLSPLAQAQVTFTGAQPVLASFASTGSISPVAVDALGDAFFVAVTPAGRILYEVPFNGGLTALKTSFKFMPSAIAVDPKGANLYFIYFGSVPSCNGSYVYLATTTTVVGASPVNMPCSFAFSGFPVSYSDPTGLATDAAGNLYVADYGGGEIFQLPAPVTSTSVPTAFMALFQQPYEVAVTPTGAIDYAALDFNNGASNTLYQVPAASFTSKIPTNGVNATTLASGLPSIQAGLAIDGAGNIYVGGGGLPTVKLGPGATQIPMYSAFDNGGFGAAVDSMGNLFLTGVPDAGTPQLVELTLSGARLGSKTLPVNVLSSPLALHFHILAGTTIGSVAVQTGGLSNLDFTDAGSSTCKAQIYASDTDCVVNVHVTPKAPGFRLGAVVLIDPASDLLATGPVFSVGSSPELIYRGGTPISVVPSGLNGPLGIAVDQAGNLLIADAFNARVLKVAPGGAQSTIGSGFTEPSGITIDGAGNVYVSDLSAGNVYKITPLGVQTTYLSGLSTPYGLSIDGNGNLFVGEPIANTVLRVTQTGVTTPMGTGYNLPYENALDTAGNLYVTDFGSGNIFKITPAGIKTTFASGISSPTGLAVDAAGNVYVAAYGGGEIDQITPAAIKTPVLTGLNGPYGVSLDQNGNLYYADYLNEDAARLMQSLPQTLSFATTAGGSKSADSPKVASLQNVGNAQLLFSLATYPVDFPHDPSGNATACTVTTKLAAAAVCTLTIDFKPVTLSGASTSIALSEQAKVATNTLNLTGKSGQVNLTGTETKLIPTVTLKAAMGASNTMVLTAKVTGSGPIPTGSITFRAGGVAMAPAVTITNGTATLTIARPASRHTVDALNTGDAVYSSAASNGILINPTMATPTITLTDTPNPAVSGAPVVLKATVSTAIPGVPPTGTVQFLVSGPVVGTGTLSGGVATFTDSTMSVGVHSTEAIYLGDINYATVTSAIVKETITH